MLIIIASAVGMSGESNTEKIEQGGKIVGETKAEPIVETKVETKTESIPFQTLQENDPNLPKGQTKVKQEGKNGQKKLK